MLGRGNFGGYIHAGFFLDFLEPGQSFHTDSFETSRFGTGFPDSGAENLDTVVCQLLGCRHHLFFCFGTARAGNDQRAFFRYTFQFDGL